MNRHAARSGLTKQPSGAEQFFQFSHRPFRGTPDPQDYVPLDSVEQEIERLTASAAQGDGIAVLTAPPGAGKTVVCERVRLELAARFRSVMLSSSGFATRRSLLQAVLFALGQSYETLSEQELRLAVLNYSRSLVHETAGVVLVIDEAHLLNARLLEELRCLTNHSQAGHSLIRVILCGQLPLEEALTSPELEALNYRITCHATLEPLSLKESAELVSGRLLHAGRTVEGIFTADALETICRVSDGNPRCLVQICDHALALAAENRQTPVTAATVREGLKSLKQLPLRWNESTVDSPPEPNDSADAALSDDWSAPLPAVEEPVSARAATRRQDADHEQTDGWSGHMVSVEVGAVSPVEARLLQEPAVSRSRPEAETADAQTVDADPVLDDEVHTALEAPTAGVRADELKRRSAAPTAPGLLDPELTEIPVEDRYARLDGLTQRLLSVPPMADLVGALTSLAPPKPTREREVSATALEQLQHSLAGSEHSPEQRLDEVIAALALVVDEGLEGAGAEDAVLPGRQSWRAVKDDGEFDLVEPQWHVEEVRDDVPPEHTQRGLDSVEVVETPRRTPPAAVPRQREQSAPRRPYARLFSRLRKQHA